MTSEPLRNAWIAAADPVITWVADLAPAAERPEALLEWITAAVESGRTNAVHTVHEAPEIGYAEWRDGRLEEVLARRFAETGTVDLFAFAASGRREIDGRRMRASARLAYVEGGSVVEAEVDDMGELLARLRPTDVIAAGGRMTRNPPVVPGPGGPHHRVLISTFTDIWLPFVPGLLEEDYELGRPFDNRRLAERHTPRLNAWLTTLRDRTRALGGRWGLHDEFTRVAPGLLDEDGLVRVDAGPPEPIASAA